MNQIVRMGLSLAVVLGLVIPSFSQDAPKEEEKVEKNKTKKRTEKSKPARRKGEEPKKG